MSPLEYPAQPPIIDEHRAPEAGEAPEVLDWHDKEQIPPERFKLRYAVAAAAASTTIGHFLIHGSIRSAEVLKGDSQNKALNFTIDATHEIVEFTGGTLFLVGVLGAIATLAIHVDRVNDLDGVE